MVASTNFEAHEPTDAPIEKYLIASDGWFSAPRYVAQLLKHPGAVVQAEAQAVGREKFPVVGCVLYPTTADNPRPAYTFPTPPDRGTVTRDVTIKPAGNSVLAHATPAHSRVG